MDHGCQMVCFQTKNANLGKFWRVLQWKILVSFMTIWSVLWPLEIFHGHLVYFVVIGFIFTRFGILYQEKSCNPDMDAFSYKVLETFKKKFKSKRFKSIQNETKISIQSKEDLLIIFTSKMT
jgi:hypothetical protein